MQYTLCYSKHYTIRSINLRVIQVGIYSITLAKNPIVYTIPQTYSVDYIVCLLETLK